MSKFDGFKVHTTAWISLLVLYFAVPLIWYPHDLYTGRWASRKHMYNLQATTVDRSGVATQTFADVVKNVHTQQGHWNSGSKMTIFKNELGCFGDFRIELMNKMITHNDTKEIHEETQLLAWQLAYSKSEHSVCTCIDQLYYASFQKSTGSDQNKVYIHADLKTKITDFLGATTAEIRDWMLGNNHHSQPYGKLKHENLYTGVGFTALMQAATSDASYVVCDDEGEKELKPAAEKLNRAQCMMRRDIEIIGVCTRSAQAVMQINAQGVVNTSHIKAFAVLSLFMFIFVTLRRHQTTGYVIPFCIAANFALLAFYWCLINLSYYLGLHTPEWSIANVAVFILTTLGTLVALLAAVASGSSAYRRTTVDDKGAPQVASLRYNIDKLGDLLTEDPDNITVIVLAQILVDVNLIVGFSLLLFSLLMEAAVTEVYSLVIVLLMVVVAAFVQHLSNILRYLQQKVLRATNTAKEFTPYCDSATVDEHNFRLLNECAGFRLYIALAVTFICVYLLISPRESQVYPGMNVYTLAVLILFLTCNGFDMIREVEARVTNTVWLSEHDTDNTRSWVLMVLVIAIIFQGGVHDFAYTAMAQSSVTADATTTYR